MVGPPARGSGVPIDARVDHPYAAYDEVPVRIAVHQEGRHLGARAGAGRGAAGVDPAGPGGSRRHARRGRSSPRSRTRSRRGASASRSWRRRAARPCTSWTTGGDNRPYRWRVRAPTYPNLQAMPAMVANNTIADVPIALGSLDPCFSCTERVEAVDVTTRRVTRLLAGGPAADLERRGGDAMSDGCPLDRRARRR